MNLSKYFLTSLVFLGVYLPIFACDIPFVEATPFDSVNRFKNSTSVITVQVIKITPLDKKSSKKKREVALDSFSFPEEIPLNSSDIMISDRIATSSKPIPIYKIVDMKIIKSYKGNFDKNKVLSFTSKEDLDLGMCGHLFHHSFYNDYLFTPEVNDLAILYLGESGMVLTWEPFNYKEKMYNDKIMLKIKAGTYRDFYSQEISTETVSKKLHRILKNSYKEIPVFEDTTTFPVYRASH